MKSNWRVYTKKADFKAIGERFGIDQVMARIIRNRGLETYEQINMYLNGTVDDMHSPHLLKDADRKSTRLNSSHSRRSRMPSSA